MSLIFSPEEWDIPEVGLEEDTQAASANLFDDDFDPLASAEGLFAGPQMFNGLGNN